MAQSTLNAAFRERLLTDFFYNMANYNSFGERNLTSGGAALAVTDQRGSANFRIIAQRTDTSGGGVPTFVPIGFSDPYIPTTSDAGQTPNWEVQGTKLVYIGDPIEVTVTQAATVSRIVVEYRKVVTSSTTGDPTFEDTTFVAFEPLSITFSEPNGTLVINQLEFELE